jgi:hypothetical protein
MRTERRGMMMMMMMMMIMMVVVVRFWDKNLQKNKKKYEDVNVDVGDVEGK